MSNEFSEHYGDLLTGSYDCVDRVVPNAYFSLGHLTRRVSDPVAALAGRERRGAGQHPPDAYGRTFLTVSTRLGQGARAPGHRL